MNILIDTSPLRSGHAIRGIGRYTRELLASLRNLETPHHIFSSDDSLPSEIDLIHYPFFDLFFATLPLRKKTKTIVTIHDVIPLVFPRHYKPGIKGTVRYWRQKIALRSVDHIITDSECSKRDITDLLHMKPESVTVVPLAASPDFVAPPKSETDAIRKKYDLPKHYVLYVGDINYNKNVPFLIRSMQYVPKLTLVLVGSQMKNTTIPEGKEIQKTIDALGLQDRVRLVDSVPTNTNDLAGIYAGATVYVQPSLYEGFGLPVLEAMQCRVPVIASCGGSLPEVAGEAALQFHPHDEQECATLIRRVNSMSDVERGKMIRKGMDQVAQFSWERTARETLAAYEKVGGS